MDTKSKPPRLVAWDFDGVLNRNVVDGRFIWADALEEDLGFSRDGFERFMFGPERVGRVMRGQVDLHDALAEWLAVAESDLSPQAVTEYWFGQDWFLDAEVMAWLRAASGKRVLATNNERHRVRFIAEEMGLAAEVDHVFASGLLGHAKPEDAFYAAIEAWSGLAPGEILLVDDLVRNTEAAAARGWQVFHFTEASRDSLPEALGLA